MSCRLESAQESYRAMASAKVLADANLNKVSKKLERVKNKVKSFTARDVKVKKFRRERNEAKLEQKRLQAECDRATER